MSSPGPHPAIGPETVVDIHCHVMSEDAEALARATFPPERDPFTRYIGRSEGQNRELFGLIRPKLVEPRSRLDDMDRMGIDVQAISVAPPQYFYWAEPSIGAAAARITNDRIAAIVSAHPDRFVGLGTVPLQDVDATLSELDRMTSELGFRGLEICTQVNGIDLDDVRFEPFFAEVAERDLLLVVHPNGTTQGERLTDYYLINVVGMPLDSTIFLARMIFGGVLARHPRLKMCVVHGGGDEISSMQRALGREAGGCVADTRRRSAGNVVSAGHHLALLFRRLRALSAGRAATGARTARGSTRLV